MVAAVHRGPGAAAVCPALTGGVAPAAGAVMPVRPRRYWERGGPVRTGPNHRRNGVAGWSGPYARESDAPGGQGGQRVTADHHQRPRNDTGSSRRRRQEARHSYSPTGHQCGAERAPSSTSRLGRGGGAELPPRSGGNTRPAVLLDITPRPRGSVPVFWPGGSWSRCQFKELAGSSVEVGRAPLGVISGSEDKRPESSGLVKLARNALSRRRCWVPSGHWSKQLAGARRSAGV